MGKEMELSTIVVIIGSIIVYQSHRQRKKIAWFAESVDMTGKVALITGSSSGIGFSTALHLAKRGATVVLLSRHDNGVTRKIMSMADNDNVHFIPLDLGSMVDIKSKCDEIKLLYKTGIDALINCAGTAFGPVVALPWTNTNKHWLQDVITFPAHLDSGWLHLLQVSGRRRPISCVLCTLS